MFKKEDFDKIKPYPDSEINSALRRLTSYPEFLNVLKYLFPDIPSGEIIEMLNSIDNVYDLQVQFMHPTVRSVVAQSSDSLTYDGFDRLNPSTPYLFIANHRDIILDSAILQALLVENSLPTSEITFGNNLMSNPFIIDFGKANKMFTVFRGGTKYEILHNSKLLSAYIRHAIIEKNESVWIAQRNGRTKDGFDKTDDALLKMLNYSGKKDFIQNFSELNIIPLSISYEYEPCGIMKLNEIYTSISSPYVKTANEDSISILKGLTEPKGRIHLSAGEPINDNLKIFNNLDKYNHNISRLSKLIDHQIYQNYKLWKTNYIAFDLLNKSNAYCDHYSNFEKDNFNETINNQIDKLAGDKLILQELYLKMYANPLLNKLKD